MWMFYLTVLTVAMVATAVVVSVAVLIFALMDRFVARFKNYTRDPRV